ncbi:hypothetical protein [Streptomyces sp. V2]|uniref:Uncharacterized protein n=1 Tax=Streptomyces niveiscabiei TaxID=164115 RepID=A0ABW9I5W5_9ACTN|nr:hypothetical protein [Streptomyces sp. V2]
MSRHAAVWALSALPRCDGTLVTEAGRGAGTLSRPEHRARETP